jgi:hypothetical protein
MPCVTLALSDEKPFICVSIFERSAWRAAFEVSVAEMPFDGVELGVVDAMTIPAICPVEVDWVACPVVGAVWFMLIHHHATPPITTTAMMIHSIVFALVVIILLVGKTYSTFSFLYT